MIDSRKHFTFQHKLSFPLNIQDDSDLGDSGDDAAGSDVDTGSDGGGGDEGDGDMAYDAADREFPGYPEFLNSTEPPHKLNSTGTSEKSHSGRVTSSNSSESVDASAESQQQQQQHANVECYR